MPTAWKPPSTCTISPVVAGNQSDRSATTALAAGSRSRTSHPSGARSAHAASNCSKPGIERAASVRSGPAATRLTRMPRAPELAREVAGRGLERGLGHAHPVVDRPRVVLVVEVQADDRSVVTEPGERRDRQRLQRVRRDLHGGRDVLPGRVEESAAEARRRCEPDRVDHAVEIGRETLGEGLQVLGRGHVELDDLDRVGELAGHPGGDAHDAPERRQHDRRALLLREAGDRERDRRVVEDPRHEDRAPLEEHQGAGVITSVAL